MQRRLVLAAFASAAEICPENHCTVQVNSIKIFTHIPLLGDIKYGLKIILIHLTSISNLIIPFHSVFVTIQQSERNFFMTYK
jgi:hypothetical protein